MDENKAQTATTPWRQPLSFVRRKNRLPHKYETLWRVHAQQYAVPIPRAGADTTVDPSYRFEPTEHFGRQAPLIVEVGSGMGHAIVHAARERPEVNFLAVEVYVPGLARTARQAANWQVENLRLAQADAPQFLPCLPGGSVSEVWSFFPDPWPKSRHEKRRLMSTRFAEEVARVLAAGGRWRIATDWEHYAEHIVAAVGATALLRREHPSWAPRFQGRVVTNFEQKARDAGRTIRDLSYIKDAD